MTLEEYLDYDDGTDTRYELAEGLLVEMEAESDLNVLIATALLVLLTQHVPTYRLRNKTEIAIASRGASTRYPDLIVLTEAGAKALVGKRRSLITADMPPPALVVEVVSLGEPGSPNYDRDYVEKPLEYAAVGIPEFWILDPDRQMVTVLTLVGDCYQRQVFRGLDEIRSPLFPNLVLTVRSILDVELPHG